MNPEQHVDSRIRELVGVDVSRWVTWEEKSQSGIAWPLRISAVLIVVATVPLAIIWWVVYKATRTQMPTCDGKAMSRGQVCMAFGRNGGTKTSDEMMHAPSTTAPVIGSVLTAVILGVVLLIIGFSFWVNSGGRKAELGEAIEFGQKYFAYRDDLMARISAAPHDQSLRHRLAALDQCVAKTAQHNGFRIDGRTVTVGGI